MTDVASTQAPPSVEALFEVLRAAEALAKAISAAPFPMRAVVGPEARACIQVPGVVGDDLDRMLHVDRAAGLMSAEPGLVGDPAGHYWQAEAERDSVLLQVWTRLTPLADPAEP